MCISFPYHFIDEVTSTVSVIPYVTQYQDGRHETSYSTITIDGDPECDFFDEQFTWVTHGRTLTWPTTYGTLETFVGRAESTFEPTKTFYGDKDCDGTVGTTAMTLPPTFDPGSFIIPLGVSSPTLKAGPLPQNVIQYLDSFATVHEQFNDIPLTACAPALPVRTACTTVLTTTSTSVSCASDEKDCVTLTETLTETNTHTPHWPTLNGSLTDEKATAAKLTTETGETIVIQATAEPVLAPTSDDSTEISEQDASSEVPETSSEVESTDIPETIPEAEPTDTPEQDSSSEIPGTSSAAETTDNPEQDSSSDVPEPSSETDTVDVPAQPTDSVSASQDSSPTPHSDESPGPSAMPTIQAAPNPTVINTVTTSSTGVVGYTASSLGSNSASGSTQASGTTSQPGSESVAAYAGEGSGNMAPSWALIVLGWITLMVLIL